MRREVRTVVALALLILVASAFPAAAQDPFGNMSNTINTSAKIWAGAIVVLGALIAGASIIMGSQNSGKWVGRFIGGSILLLLTLKGADLIKWLSSSFGVGQ